MCVADPDAGTANAGPVIFCYTLNRYSNVKQPLTTSLQFFIQTVNSPKNEVESKSFCLFLLQNRLSGVSFWKGRDYGVWYFL
jgi:hypothetical protein